MVLIDPLENPDGRERYIQWFDRTRGVRANADPDAFEHHDEPWPGGRFNHYLIDMNRDWAWQSQRETQARVAAYAQWSRRSSSTSTRCGGNVVTYFFPPPPKPINANLPKQVEDWLDVFGRANAAEFSKRGWPFFVAERFDLFYPGYGDSWPSLHGAIGMTYEVAGGGAPARPSSARTARAHPRRSRSRHFTTGITTVRTAAHHRAELLRYTYDAARAQIESGRNTFLIVPGSPNFPALDRPAAAQGRPRGHVSAATSIRATRLDRDAAETRRPSRPAPPSSPRASRSARLANTLLEKAPAFGKGFVEEQRAKAEADEPDDFYDLTTWSLPAGDERRGVGDHDAGHGHEAISKTRGRRIPRGAYGYLVDALDPHLYRFADACSKATCASASSTATRSATAPTRAARW